MTSSLAMLAKINYIGIRDIYAAILTAGRHCAMAKKDIADTLRNVPAAIA
jgi:hypothetical protein